MKKIDLDTLDLDSIINYYKENHTRANTAKQFNISLDTLDKILNLRQVKRNNKGDLIKATCREKYGVDSVFQTAEFKEKTKQTSLEKYGTEKPQQSSQVKEKIKQTHLKKYGVNHFNNKEKRVKNQIERYGKIYTNREKAKQTSLERYGVEQYNNQNKIIQTTLDKYGKKSVWQVEEVKEKVKQTHLEKYGVEHYTNREKAIQTCLDRYGVEFPCQNETLNEKAKQTHLEKYGGIRPAHSEEIKDKIKATMSERYGVEWSCLLDSARTSYNNDSKPNRKFAQLLEDNGIEYEREFILETKAFDFKVGNNLIEINPFAFHNSTWTPFEKEGGIDKKYHLNKSLLALKYNYNCLHVWDWDDLDKIIQIIKQPSIKVAARKCVLKEVSETECDQFLNLYHLQGKCRKQIIRLGLYYNEDLIEIMTFGKPRYNKNYQWELLRLCSKPDYMIIGGANKLYSNFINNYKPKSIISYCDNSKFSGHIYQSLGMEKIKTSSVSKHWYNPKTKQHITNNLLNQRGFDQLFKTNYGKGTSNKELMLQHGFIEIYDCGQSTYIQVI